MTKEELTTHIKAEAQRLGLCYVSHRVEKEWTAAQFKL